MSERLRVAFLNCHNLFPAGSHEDAPPTDAELSAKVDALGDTLAALFGGVLPDVIALAEVAAEDLGVRVAQAVAPGTYAQLWSDVPSPIGGRPSIGLMIHYNMARLVRVTLPPEDADVPMQWSGGLEARTKWMAVPLQLQFGSQGVFWMVANHWKSQMGGKSATQPQRMDAARALGAFYRDTAKRHSEAMVLAGDFNCEPCDRPFYDQKTEEGDPNQLRAVRERPLVLRTGLRLAYFYNPMWRWFAEPDYLPVASAPGYVRPRPIGTLASGARYGVPQEWKLWDQIMVTRACLTGAFIQLDESSVVLAPSRDACSDHMAVGAVFNCQP